MENLLFQKLTFVSVNHLIGQCFFIPDYQRGYRWQPKQVEQLLDDLWEFYLESQNKALNDVFPYCLQPIVVAHKKENTWELIDGQQRLTTIMMVLEYIDKDTYKIEYETRNDVPNKLDEYYRLIAKNTICKWFQSPKRCGDSLYSEKQLKKNFSDILAKPAVYLAHFIWYNVTEEVLKDQKLAIDIFDRLNIGKIGLTNSELIKALFMTFIDKSTKSESHKKLNQIKLGEEWGRIEQRLQQPLFWNFICQSPEKYITRIDYLFDILSDKQENDEEKYTFNHYTKRAKTEDVEMLWQEVKQLFQLFEDWYSSHEMFHYIGYLITTGTTIKELLALRYTESGKLKAKNSVQHEMLLKCKESIRGINLNDDDFFITNNTAVKRKVLLLFNVLSLTQTKDKSSRLMRFPFDEYRKKDEKGRIIWDIEHVHSQTDRKMDMPDKIDWLYCMISYFTGEWDRSKCYAAIEELIKDEEKSLCKRLLSLIEQAESSDDITEKFDGLYKELREKYESDEKFECTHSLGNLTLLDKWTNRSYQNAFFPVKRSIIIHKAKQGCFIPLCTQNVFMKAYTKHLGSLTEWTEHDCRDYKEQIINIISIDNEK